jgi:hypothetical protein
MSSPTLDQSIFAADAVTQTLHEIQPGRAERRADVVLTARAVLTVTLLGAGLWYLLWKMALNFVAGH